MKWLFSLQRTWSGPPWRITIPDTLTSTSRGVDLRGLTLLLHREFIKTEIRAIAEDLCTRQIGHRTERDAPEAAAWEVREHRYTSPDREIRRAADQTANTAATFQVLVPSGTARRTKTSRVSGSSFSKRLDWPKSVSPNAWHIRSDFETLLRRCKEQQRTIAAYGALMSDARLPLATLDLKDMRSVEGRVLVHGEEENGRDAGRSYLLLEGTDALAYYVPYFQEIECARHQGKLNTNSFVRFRKLFAAGKSQLAVEDFGSAETILKNKQHRREAAAGFVARRLIPAEDGWGGWLGGYQTALKQTVYEMLDCVRTKPARQRSGR